MFLLLLRFLLSLWCSLQLHCISTFLPTLLANPSWMPAGAYEVLCQFQRSISRSLPGRRHFLWVIFPSDKNWRLPWPGSNWTTPRRLSSGPELCLAAVTYIMEVTVRNAMVGVLALPSRLYIIIMEYYYFSAVCCLSDCYRELLPCRWHSNCIIVRRGHQK